MKPLTVFTPLVLRKCQAILVLFWTVLLSACGGDLIAASGPGAGGTGPIIETAATTTDTGSTDSTATALAKKLTVLETSTQNLSCHGYDYEIALYDDQNKPVTTLLANENASVTVKTILNPNKTYMGSTKNANTSCGTYNVNMLEGASTTAITKNNTDHCEVSENKSNLGTNTPAGEQRIVAVFHWQLPAQTGKYQIRYDDNKDPDNCSPDLQISIENND